MKIYRAKNEELMTLIANSHTRMTPRKNFGEKEERFQTDEIHSLLNDKIILTLIT